MNIIILMNNQNIYVTLSKSNTMEVVKRNGKLEKISFDKIIRRIESLCWGLDTEWVDPTVVAQDTIKSLYNNISTEEIDFVSADTCAARIIDHPDFNKLAARICISNLHKTTSDNFLEVVSQLYTNIDSNGNHCPLISKQLYDIVQLNNIEIESKIDYSRDYNFNFFGIKTLERSYLIRIKKSDGNKIQQQKQEKTLRQKYGRIVERPQHLFMRVALGIHGTDLEKAFTSYDYMSQMYFTHATPTMFNSGTPRPQMSSCFMENTEVVTMNRGVINIQDLYIGDTLVTHTNTVKKISQLHKNKLNNRKIYKLKVAKTKEIHVTGDHRFMGSSDKKTSSFHRIDELSTGDYIAIPNYTGTENNITLDITNYAKGEYDFNDDKIWNTATDNFNEINRMWVLDDDLMNFIGMFLGDGDLVTKKNSDNISVNRGIMFTLFNRNTEEKDFIINVGSRIFDIKPLVHTEKNEHTVKIMFNSNIIGNVFEALFGKGIMEKRIPELMFSLHKSNIYGLLAGLIITSHGCISKEGFICVTMSNGTLINQLYHLFRLHGIDVSINKVINPCKLSDLWTLSIPLIKEVLDQTYTNQKDRLQICYEKLKSNKNNKNQSTPIIIDGIKHLRIESITETDLSPEYVYTIGVDDDHSYNVEGLVCENCFLLGMHDSIDGIFKTISDSAQISKWAGGIGIHITGIRARNSIIRGTNGTTDGIIPLSKLLNMLAKYVNQGGKRNGSIALYIEPWHADVWEFCELRRPQGEEELRARDLFLALWVPDLFMKRVNEDKMWSLMCPDECKGLTDVYGTAFEELYEKYESEGKYKRQIPAQKLWHHILTSQTETGMPYMTYKDNVNKKSNQKNLGTIKSSNLCVRGDTRIMTNNGSYRIRDLKNQAVNIWNGFEFSTVTVKQTGYDASMCKIELSNGEELVCTDSHKFYVKGKHSNEKTEIRACDLLENMELIDFSFPVVDGPTILDDSYNKGLLYNDSIHSTEEVTEYPLIPYNYNISSKLRWLEGLCDGMGKLVTTNELTTISIIMRNKDRIRDIRTLINTLGADCYITTSKVMNDPVYKLSISPYYIQKLSLLGFKPKAQILNINYCNKMLVDKIRIKKVVQSYDQADTYCYTEPIKHLGMFNGIVTGQCAEIMEYSDENNYAVCNLGSICLPRFIETVDGRKTYNYTKLLEVTKIITENLDKIIDVNYYPVEETRRTNIKNRPIGIGVQGLADVYNIMNCSYGSNEAKELNKRIFETIYYGAVLTSNKIAIEKGPYSTYEGSPISEGIFQFDMWGLKKEDLLMNWDWETLRSSIKTHGVRNSLLTAVMPTASTSQIMGCVECIEPYTTNVYVRTTIAGEYTVINENLVRYLIGKNMWTEQIKNEIIFDNGSVQHIEEIDQHTKDVYLTAFELPQVHIVTQAVQRGPFIDQSQSMNIFLKDPNFERLTKSHMYGWKNGLKTGMYYLRSQPAVDPIKFGLDPLVIKNIKAKRNIANSSGTYDTSELLNTDNDPRRVNEIEQSHEKKNKYSRPTDLLDCEMCSG